MPITKAVRSAHVCDLPDPMRLMSLAYLDGTEWTCDECAKVYMLSSAGMAGPYWVDITPPPTEEPPAEPVQE